MPDGGEHDQAQLALDEREQELDELARQLGLRSAVHLHRSHQAIERSRAMLDRSRDRLDRDQAALERDDARAGREQAEVDQAAADAGRELAYVPADPGELIEQTKALRRRLWAVAAELTTAEKEAAQIRDELLPHDPEPE